MGQLFFWLGVALDVALVASLLIAGEIVRLSGRRLRLGIARSSSFAAVAILLVLTMGALLGLSRDDPSSAFRLAGVFLIIWGTALVTAIGVAVVRRVAARSKGGVVGLSPLLLRLSEPLPDALPDAVLGTPRGQIDVSVAHRCMTITIPARRSRKTTIAGLAFMAPAVFLLGRLFYVLAGVVTTGLDPGSVALVASAGVLGNLVMNIPFWLAGLWGAHLIFGDEVVTAEPHRVFARKVIWGMSAPGAVIDIEHSAVARPERDQSTHWTVVVERVPEAATARFGLRFGAGNLSHDQSQALADAITQHYAELSGHLPAASV